MDLEPMVTCPYDKSHRIRQSRLQWHLRTCLINHQDAKKKHCYYDASHVISKDQFEQHLLECPSREVIMNSSNSDENTQDAPYILPISTNQNADDDGGWGKGEWSQDAECPTYNPLEAIQSRPIVHPKIGSSKGERRRHRRQETHRFNDVTKKEKEKEKEDNC